MNGKFEFFAPVGIENIASQLQINLSQNSINAYSFILVSFPRKLSNTKQVKVFKSSGLQMLNYLVEGNSYMFKLDQPGLYLIAVKADNSCLTHIQH